MKKQLKTGMIALVVMVMLFAGVSTLAACGKKDKTINLTFSNRTVYYDAYLHKLEVSGTIPSGVTVTYTCSNPNYNVATRSASEPGIYNVTASLEGDGYKSKTLSARLTIVDDETRWIGGYRPDYFEHITVTGTEYWWYIGYYDFAWEMADWLVYHNDYIYIDTYTTYPFGDDYYGETWVVLKSDCYIEVIYFGAYENTVYLLDFYDLDNVYDDLVYVLDATPDEWFDVWEGFYWTFDSNRAEDAVYFFEQQGLTLYGTLPAKSILNQVVFTYIAYCYDELYNEYWVELTFATNSWVYEFSMFE